MTRKEISEQIKEDIKDVLPHIRIEEIHIIVKSFIKVLTRALLDGRFIYLRTFGTLFAKYRKPKIARNIYNNSAINLEGFYKPFIKPAKEFALKMKARTEIIKQNTSKK